MNCKFHQVCFISFKQETTSPSTKFSYVTQIGNEVWTSSTNWNFTPVIQRLMQTDKMTWILKETQNRSLGKNPNLEKKTADWLRIERLNQLSNVENSQYYTQENRGFTQTYKTKLNSLTESCKTQTAQQIGWWRLELEAKLLPTRAASWLNLLYQSNDRRIKLQQTKVQKYKCLKLDEVQSHKPTILQPLFPPMDSVVNQTTVWSNLENYKDFKLGGSADPRTKLQPLLSPSYGMACCNGTLLPLLFLSSSSKSGSSSVNIRSIIEPRQKKHLPKIWHPIPSILGTCQTHATSTSTFSLVIRSGAQFAYLFFPKYRFH